MLDIIFRILSLGLVIFILAKSMQGITVSGYSTAVLVALTYALANETLGTLLSLLTMPLIIVTIGAFKLIINTLLLLITDQLIDGFEIKDLRTTFLMAILITVSHTILDWTF